MTDRIDLDDVDVGGEEEEEDEANYGDWFWRGTGDPSDEPDPDWDAHDDADAGDGGGDVGEDGSDVSESDGDADVGEGGVGPDVSESGSEAGADASASVEGEAAREDASDADAAHSADPIPHVPRQNSDKPVGIPVDSGGGGTGPGDDGDEGDADVPGASGPHGGGVDDMTMALTYGAVKRLADPGRAVADARGWCDWIGIVGEVGAPVLNKLQRDEGLDLDFFNGSGMGPAERLADIDEHSMFYAERMVVVGVEGEDERIATEADWEFVALSEAAEKAGWNLSPD